MKQTAFLYNDIVKTYLTLKGCLPFNKSQNNKKSLTKLYSGYLKVAGLFFSKKKWPIHAKPYPIIGIIAIKRQS